MALNVGFIGVDQICFTGDKDAVYARGRQQLDALSRALGFSLVAYPHTIITRGEADEAAAHFRKAEVDFLLVQNASFAAGETILPLAKLGVPLGLWSVPEPTTTGILRLNSFCGINMYASILTNYLKHHNPRYKYFIGDAEDVAFVARFSLTVRALSALKRLRTAKVALVGGIAPGFNDLYFDERIAERLLGVNIQRNHEYSEIKERALSYSDADMRGIIDDCLSGYCATCDGAERDIATNARFLKAYEDFAADFGYEAIAISCWPKIQAEFMTCACHTIAKLNDAGIPAACEGDVPGAISMLLLRYLSDGKPVTLMDLASHDETDDTMQLWHCGPTAASLADPQGVRLGLLEENTDKVGGKRYLRYIHDMRLRPGAATLNLFCEDFGSMFVAGGVFGDAPKDRFTGSSGWLGEMTIDRKPVTARDMIHTILTRGIQHHFPVVYGDYTQELMEIAAWLGLPTVQAVPYADHLQPRA